MGGPGSSTRRVLRNYSVDRSVQISSSMRMSSGAKKTGDESGSTASNR